MSVVKPQTIIDIIAKIQKYTKNYVKDTALQTNIKMKTDYKNKKQISIQELKRRLL